MLVRLNWTDRLLSGAWTGVLPVLDPSCLWTGRGEVSWEAENLHSLSQQILNAYCMPLFQASVQIPVLPFFEGLPSAILTSCHFLIYKRRLIFILSHEVMVKIKMMRYCI